MHSKSKDCNSKKNTRSIVPTTASFQRTIPRLHIAGNGKLMEVIFRVILYTMSTWQVTCFHFCVVWVCHKDMSHVWNFCVSIWSAHKSRNKISVKEQGNFMLVLVVLWQLEKYVSIKGSEIITVSVIGRGRQSPCEQQMNCRLTWKEEWVSITTEVCCCFFSPLIQR